MTSTESSFSIHMLIPFGDSISLKCPPQSHYCAMELSPDGNLFAVVTTQNIQIWSAGPDTILLSQNRIERNPELPEDLLYRIFVVWREDSSRFAVICGEGVVATFTLEYVESLFEVNPTTHSTAYIPRCQTDILSVMNIDEYGLPLSVCSLESNFVIGTNTGNLIESDWNGSCRGYPVAAPLMIHLPEISKDLPPTFQVVSMDYDSHLGVLVLALDNGLCVLFRVSFQERIHFASAHLIAESGVVCVRVGSIAHVLAIARSDCSISVFRLSWQNESLQPVQCFEFDIRRLDDLYPPSGPAHVTSMAWTRENDHLAVVYAGRCFAVWNQQEAVIWLKTLARGCCQWSATGDSLLFGDDSLHLQRLFIIPTVRQLAYRLSSHPT